MSQKDYYGMDTLAVHAGASPDPTTGARATPIYLSTSFVFPDSDQAAALFNMERSGHVYSRLSNPTVSVLEERIAALERGVGAHRHRQRPGGAAPGHRDHRRRRLAHRRVARALRRLAQPAALHVAPFRHRHHFRRPARRRGVARCAAARTRGCCSARRSAIPGLDVLDIAMVADIAHGHSVPLLVDSTFTTPYLIRPVRPWRRPDLPLGDQVPLRPWHGARRTRRRLGPLRLGRVRQIPRAQRTLRRLPFDGVHRGVDGGGVPPARAARRLAGLRRLHEPDERLPDPAGHRDAVAADGASRRQCPPGRGIPAGS